MQKLYVSKVCALLTPGTTTIRNVPVGVTYGFNSKTVNLNETDLPSIARGQLISLKTGLKAAALKTTDRMSRLHLQDLAVRIEKALDPK